jgi:hypothetical protein
VSRKYGGQATRAAENKRIRRSRERPPAVAVRYQYPRCGGPHPAADHALTADLLEQLRSLSIGDLLELNEPAAVERVCAAPAAELACRQS